MTVRFAIAAISLLVASNAVASPQVVSCTQNDSKLGQL
jgi:hypothetical protein